MLKIYISVIKANTLVLKLKIKYTFNRCFKNTFRILKIKKNLNNIYLLIEFNINGKEENSIDFEIYDGIIDIFMTMRIIFENLEKIKNKIKKFINYLSKRCIDTNFSSKIKNFFIFIKFICFSY